MSDLLLLILKYHFPQHISHKQAKEMLQAKLDRNHFGKMYILV